jgi:archaellum biogenesis ATPase FlaH
MATKFESLQAPDALRELRGWLVWRWVRRPDRPKALKMPYYVSGPVRKHTHGSAEDRALLVTFEEAKKAADLHDFAGVGLALMPEFGITALDFDNCVKDGVIDPRVEQLTIGTYAELSPSGTGVRAFMRGESPDSKDSTPADNSFGFETFHGKGFVTFTGDVTDTTKLTGDENTVAPLTDAVKAFCATRFKRLERVRAECVGAGKATFGMSPEQITDLLNKLPDDLTYDEWRNVGMAVHHETEGDGFDIWDEWSSRSPKYTSSAYGMERWVSFGRNTSAEYTTMGSVLLMIRESGGDTGLEVASADEFEALPMPVGGRFNIRSHSDFASQVRSVSWIVKDFLPKATLGVLFGESGSGKTFASYDLCAAVCRGIEWNGKRVTKGRVLYVVAEGVAGFVNRIKAYCHQQGIKPSDIDMDVISDLTPNLLEPAQITDLIKDIKKREPYDLIVMDTFAQVMPGANENSGEDVGKALAECKRIHRHTGAMVLLVHHSGKDASKGARGWSGLRAAADVELEVLRSDELRSISVTKLKDGQDGANIGFKLHTVILGEDEDGDDITSCIVEYTNTGRATKEKGAVVGPKERQILMVLNEVFGLGADQEMPLPELIEAAAAQLAPPVDGKRDNRKRDVTRCIDSLSAKNYLFVEDGMVKLPESGNA